MTDGDAVKGSRCACGARFVPPRPRCSECGATTEEVEVPGVGRLLSWTVQKRPPEGFTAPLVVGIVALESGASAVAAGPDTDEGLALDQAVRVWAAEDGRLRFAPLD